MDLEELTGRLRDSDALTRGSGVDVQVRDDATGARDDDGIRLLL